MERGPEARRVYLAGGLLRMRKAVVLLIACLAVIAAAGADKKHREMPAAGEGRLVTLEMTALDNHGQPVTDLQASDIKLLDNGKPQPVVFFRRDHVPELRTALSAQEYSNRSHAGPAQVTVILFDMLNARLRTDSYSRYDILKALQGLESSAGVYLYLLNNKGSCLPIHPLPNAEADLEGDRHWTEHIQPELDKVLQQIWGFRPPDDQIEGIRFQMTVQALSVMRTQLAGFPGRKNLVWVTHGVPFVIPDVGGQLTDLSPAWHQLSEGLAFTDIAVYSVAQSSRGAGAQMGTLSDQALQEISDLTGGRYYASDAVDAAVNQAATDSRAGYTIGYFPTAQEWNGKFHKVRIASDRRDLRFNAEKGYYAYPYEGDVREQGILRIAAVSPFDSPQIGLRASVSQRSHFEIHIDPSDLVLRPRGDAFEARLGLTFVEADPEEPVLAPVTVTLSPGEREQALKDGIKVVRDVTLKASSQNVRIVVLDLNSDRYGTLTVPLPGQ
jgi:VWFA-related protein